MQSLEPEITRSTYISSWFWTKSLIRSMGAAAVLETAAETPPMRKSVRNALASLGFRATSDIFTKTKGQRFGKKKIDKSGRIDKKVADRKWVQLQCRKEHWSSYTRSNNFFFPFFSLVNTVLNTRIFFSSTLIQCHRPFAGKRGSEDLLRQPRFDLVQGE